MIAALHERQRTEAMVLALAFNDPSKIADVFPKPVPRGPRASRWWGGSDAS